MPAFQSRAARNAFEAQVALARIGISSGSIDGVAGSQTRAALRAFQEREGLPATGELDGATRARLVLSEAPERFYVIAAEDLRRLKPLGRTWLAKSQQNELDYETALELVSEKAMAHPQLIRSLNPEVNWNAVSAGLAVKVPHVWPAPVRTKAASVRVRLSTRTLQAFDSNSNLLAHFPCSIARQVDKRPVGQLFVDTIAFGPNYRFDPDMYPESPEARTISQPLMIPSGPNNPVGIAWIGLNKPGYGIHGTPRPEDVGRTESHGCFRLANWNADLLARLVTVGTPVHVEP